MPVEVTHLHGWTGSENCRRAVWNFNTILIVYIRVSAQLMGLACPTALQGIANRLKQALNMDAKSGGTPDAAQNAAAGPTSATPGGPGTDQSSAGLSNTGSMQSSGTGGMTNSSMMGGQTTDSRSGGVASPVGPGTDQSSEGLSSTGGNMQSGRTGEMHEGRATGMSTGQTGELRTGGGTGTTTGGSNVSTMGTIASTGIPHSSEMLLPVRHLHCTLYPPHDNLHHASMCKCAMQMMWLAQHLSRMLYRVDTIRVPAALMLLTACACRTAIH